MNASPPATALPAPGEEGAVRPLLRAIRAHRVLVALATLAALGGAIAFLTLRSPNYEATANVLVNPLPQEDQTFLGLDLLRDSGDATRTVQTAATLLESPDAAGRTGEALGDDWTEKRVLNSVSVDPIGESNIVGVTGTADEAELAARLADEFARSALALRGQELSREVETAITRTEAELAATPRGSPNAAVLSDRLSRLTAVEESGDPTLTLQQEATVPSSPTGPGPVIVIPLALLAGFALGAGGALLLELLDRRVSDAEEAFSLYPVPVLARIPILGRKANRPEEGVSWHMPAEVRQPFQSLVVQLEQRARPLGTILVTSPSRGDGKTTSAINLAVSLAASGRRVVLLDGDLRHPRIADEMSIPAPRTQAELAAPGSELRELLVRPAKEWPLYVLPVEPELDDHSTSEAAMRRLPRLIDDARSVADCVVVDTPPLGEVSDALRLIPRVDDVLLVVRVGNTLRAHLKLVSELLDRGGHQAEGSILVDSSDRTGAGYGYGIYGHGRGAVGGELVLNGDLAEPEHPVQTAESKPGRAGG